MEDPVGEVPVGEYLRDGTFVGEQVEFDGYAVEIYDGLYTGSGDPSQVHGLVLRLYECPDGYRVHELLWPLIPGRSAVASLYPVPGDEGSRAYTEEEVREEWGSYFQAYFDTF
jgi:hypothetical protein